MAAKGKWAQGIRPRSFYWIMKDRIAVCERPGGYGSNHRRVRRQEEIIWIREQQFTYVVSLIPAPHNLHNYDEYDVSWLHWPLGQHDDVFYYIAAVYPQLKLLFEYGAKLLMHQNELSDRLCGLMGGYILWDGLVDTGPRAIMAIEQITQRQMGPIGREIVALGEELRINPPPPRPKADEERDENGELIIRSEDEGTDGDEISDENIESVDES